MIGDKVGVRSHAIGEALERCPELRPGVGGWARAAEQLERVWQRRGSKRVATVLKQVRDHHRRRPADARMAVDKHAVAGSQASVNEVGRRIEKAAHPGFAVVSQPYVQVLELRRENRITSTAHNAFDAQGLHRTEAGGEVFPGQPEL